MRLHRLRLTAFQAFAGGETVDFDALAEAGLFLLHGDTGAGKTTLLDAVCFALYGTVPGARARDARLRSDHADPATRTEVELELTLRERRLRIVRSPRQERPKRRGEGLTEEVHTCTVEQLVDDDWVTLAARPDEARAELGDLLGMSCEQFCQVVLLPQGEFATFLRADSGERQAVLERLFGTDRFTSVEHWLTDRRKAASAALADQGSVVRDLLSRAAQAAGVEPPAELDEVPAWIGDLGVAAQAGAATAAESATAARRARAAADAALTAGRELAARRARHAAATQELARWEAAAPARAAAAAELATARRAAPVAPLLAACAVDFPRIAGKSDRASAEELRARAGELRAVAGGLDVLVAVEERLARDEAELYALARQADDAGARAQQATRALAQAVDDRASLDGALLAARNAADSTERLAAEAQAAVARAQAATERDALTTEQQRARDHVRTATDAEQTTRATWLDVREARLAGMAAELAEGLATGEPCAVCGSVEHPTPAARSLLDAPLAQQEQEAERAHARAAQARADAERTLADIEGKLAAARAVAGDAEAAQLATQATQLATERNATHATAAKLADAERALATLSLAVEGHEQQRRTAETTETKARATHAERTAALAADRSRIAQARAEHPTVAARATALRSEADSAEAHAATAEATARATDAAEQAGFPTLAAAREAIRDEAQQAALEQRIADFDTGLAERRASAGDPELQAAAAAPAPDLPTLEASAHATARADEEATRHDTLATQRLTALTALSEQLDDALEAHAPVAERERRVRELAALVDGSSAANRLHMRLSAYVLAARLEEVAAAATLRLERMSDGRYQLVHTDERARGERRAGLELRIVDGWTGRERAPSTLSGGETFTASLALALGLADVVAAESGGSRLETLFVDEGFGTLDEDTLDTVLDVLDGLREGGRAVGIVSHVAELRQRIPAQVRVVKGRDGSRVEQRAAAAAG